MARKFLISIAIIIGLLIVGGAVLSQFGESLIAWYLRPSGTFDSQDLPPAPDYADWSGWAVGDPDTKTTASLIPEGQTPPEPSDIAVFYLHPTSYWGNDFWVAPIDEKSAVDRLDHIYLKGQASAFAPFGALYAPRYRQIALGAFLANDENMMKSLGVAGTDVRAAFQSFLERIGPDTPFIIAGHSQGAFHGLTLLHTSLNTADRQSRLIAAYLIGWTIAPDADLPAWTSPCDAPDQVGCVLSWQTFGPGGDPSNLVQLYKDSPSMTGASKEGEAMLCINPLSFTRTNETIAADQNLGGVAITGPGQPLGAPVPALVGARCDDEGILYVTQQPEGRFNQYVMPGNNLHAQDVQLFYRNIQENLALRIKAFLANGAAESR